jgi:hypothetical protein
MSYSGGIVSKPVTMTDIAQAVGNASRDLGYLATYGAVVKWAKYKFTRYATLGETGSHSTSEYWKGTQDANNRQTCGLKIPYNKNVTLGKPNTSGFLYTLVNGGYSWDYLRPTGGIDSFPFRMLDMDGYDANCVNPLPVPPDGVVRVQGGNGVMHLHVATDMPNGNLGLAILDDAVSGHKLNAYYASIVVYSADHSQYWYKSASVPLSSLSTDLEARNIMLTNLPTSGTYYARTFLSAIQLTQNQNNIPEGTEFIACENEAMQITFVNATPYYVIITKAMWDTSSKLSYSVTFTNNTGAAVSVTGMRIDFVNSGGSVVKTVSIESRTIGANSYYQETGTQLLLRQDGMKMKVYATFGTTNITEEKTI